MFVMSICSLLQIMTRPKKNRTIQCTPVGYYFKPRGIPLNKLEEVVLEPDELEALRLADAMCMSHEQAAAMMTVSRATFGRIIKKARKKLIDCILNGKAIRVSENLSGELNYN